MQTKIKITAPADIPASAEWERLSPAPDIGPNSFYSERLPSMEAGIGDLLQASWTGGTYQSPHERHQRAAGRYRRFVVLADGTLEHVGT